MKENSVETQQQIHILSEALKIFHENQNSKELNVNGDGNKLVLNYGNQTLHELCEYEKDKYIIEILKKLTLAQEKIIMLMEENNEIKKNMKN